MIQYLYVRIPAGFFRTMGCALRDLLHHVHVVQSAGLRAGAVWVNPLVPDRGDGYVYSLDFVQLIQYRGINVSDTGLRGDDWCTRLEEV